MIKQQSILSKLLSQDNLEWGGIRKVFADFYEMIREKLIEDPVLSKNVDENLSEIIDFIMLRLYKVIYTNSKGPSLKEQEV